jgi:tripartite ATP-independent transporter DctP family solute receptor
MKKCLIITMVSLLVVCMASAASAKMTLKLGLVAPPTHPHSISQKILADYVKEKTNGEITIDVFPMGQLGGERSMVEQVQGGTLDIADVTTAVMSNFVPEISMIDLPFIWPARGVAYSVLGDSEFLQIVTDAFPKRGMVAFGFGENEFRDLTNIKKEVRKPEDVKGMKIRVMESPVYLETWRTLNASPVPMPFPEVYNALQQGVIDAQENPLLTSILMKFTEVCPYVTILNYSLAETVKVMNIDRWKQLTPAQQQIFREGALLALKANREGSLKMAAEELAKLEAAGKVKVTRLTAEERSAFNKAMAPVYAKWEKQLGDIPNKPEYGRFAGKPYLQMLKFKIQQYD